MHFTNFNRNLVYFPWIKDLTTLQVLITLNEINMSPAFLEKGSINSFLKKVVFCKISHFTTFLNTYSIYYKHLVQLYRYLKFKRHNLLQSGLFFEKLDNLLLLMLFINLWPIPDENYKLIWRSYIYQWIEKLNTLQPFDSLSKHWS